MFASIMCKKDRYTSMHRVVFLHINSDIFIFALVAYNEDKLRLQ